VEPAVKKPPCCCYAHLGLGRPRPCLPSTRRPSPPACLASPVAPRPSSHRGLCSSEGMGLWTLLEGFLLLANALAILNEDRFLAPRGWNMSEVSGNGQTKSLKGQIVGLIYATQFLRMPLIALNVLIIVVKLVSG
ncbi:unnamed protein product, partial [Urochloa humidicola]